MPLGDVSTNSYSPKAVNSFANVQGAVNTGINTGTGNVRQTQYANDNPNVTGYTQPNLPGTSIAGQTYQHPELNPALTPEQQKAIAQGLGLIGAGYNQDVNYQNKLYGINSQQGGLSGDLINLDNADIRSQMGDVNNDNAYRQKMIGSYQGDLGLYGQDINSFNQDRQTYANQLANTHAQLGQQLRMDNFNTMNKYVANGAFSTPGLAMNNENNFGTTMMKADAANQQNKLQNTGLDRSINGTNRSINGTNRDIYGQENQIDQNKGQMDRLNNNLAKNGIRLKQNNLSMDQLKAEFDNRVNQLGVTKGLDTNKLFEQLQSGNSASAQQLFKTLFPDLVG